MPGPKHNFSSGAARWCGRVFIHVILCTFATHLHADTITGTGWTGKGANNKWSTTGNWDSAAPNTSGTGDRNLFFGQGWKNAGGDGFTSATNDLTAWHGYRITFEDIASDSSAATDQSFTILGLSFTLFDFGANFPRIENRSYVNQTFALSNATLGLSGAGASSKAEINPVNGDLTFNAGTKIDLVDTTQLQIFGNNGRTVTFNDVISSSGNAGNNSLAIGQNSTVVFAAVNTYLGDTFVSSGTLQFNGSGAARSLAIRLGATSGSAAARVNYNSSGTFTNLINVRSGSTGTKTISTTNLSGGPTISGSVYLDNDLTVTNASGNSINFSGGEFDLKNQTLTVNSAGSVSIGAVVKNTSGTGKIYKAGNGTLTLSGNNTYTGDTTISAGTLLWSTFNNALGTGGTVTLNDANTGIANTALLRNQAGTLSRNIIVAAQGTGTTTIGNDTGNTSINYNGSLTLNRTATLKAGSSGGSITFNGAVSGAGGVNVTGAGSVTFAGAKTYTGDTTIGSGSVLFLTGSGSITNSTNIIVNDGAALNVTARTDGTITLTNSQVLSGNGTITGAVVIASGTTISPGASIGTLTNRGALLLNGGGTWRFEIQDATNSPGAGTDCANVFGDFGVLATSGNKFTIKLASLTNNGVAGHATNFNYDTSYTWVVATTSSGAITNFSTNSFAIDDSSFSNDLAGGTFAIDTNNALLVRFIANHAPAANNTNITIAPGLVWKIKLTNLVAALASDADGDAVDFAGFSAASHGTVSTNSTHLFYTPNDDLADSFTFTVRDRRTYRSGDTVRSATATVSITKSASSGSAQAVTVNEGTATVKFAGIPGFSYEVQRATSLTEPVNWTTLWTTNAPAAGVFEFVDQDAPSPQAYYRLVQH